MSSPQGAIIRVIHHILKSQRMVSNWFDEDVIIHHYRKLQQTKSSRDEIAALIKRHKKHNGDHDLKTFKDNASLRNWLLKHSKRKVRTVWFYYSVIKGFKLKSDLIGGIRAHTC